MKMFVIFKRTSIVLLERVVKLLIVLLLHIFLLFPSSTRDPFNQLEKDLCIQLNYLAIGDSLATDQFKVVYIHFLLKIYVMFI